MKLQLQGQGIRLRVDEAELARLFAGEVVVNRIELGATIEFAQSLVLSTNTKPALILVDGSWKVELPRNAVEAYAAQLPCRHALAFMLDLGGTEKVGVDFEVDVRDSLKARGPRRHQPMTG